VTSPTTEDDGQLMILMIFFALIIAAIITAVVDVSTVFLAQREMQSTVDGAALAAAQHDETSQIYTGTLGSFVPLDAVAATAAATSYVADPTRIPHNCRISTYRLDRADVDGATQTVTVTVSCRVPLPLVGLVTRLWSNGVPVTATAAARAAVAPLG
jgi:uncharacterized membrane protein